MQRPGEILIKGPNVAGFLQGVVGDRIEVRENEQIATGDLGYYDATGEIILVGRKDHMLNVMGEKLHPSNIESVTMALTGIEDAMANVATDENGNTYVVLDVVCHKLEERMNSAS